MVEQTQNISGYIMKCQLGGIQISTGLQGKLLKQAMWESSQLMYVGRALELISVKSSLWICFMGSTSSYTIMCCSGSKGQLERQHLIDICRPKFTVLVDISSSWESQNSLRWLEGRIENLNII